MRPKVWIGILQSLRYGGLIYYSEIPGDPRVRCWELNGGAGERDQAVITLERRVYL